MGHDTGHLFRLQNLQQAGGRGYSCIFRIAAGSEGIGLRILDQIDGRHRQIRRFGQASNNGEEFRSIFLMRFHRIVHAQHHLVRLPVAEQVHCQSNEKRNQCATGATDEISNAHKQGCQSSQQHGGLGEIHDCQP